MRLIGLTKLGYVTSILMQALFFVLPSIVLGYLTALPSLVYLINWMFKGNQKEYEINCVPTWNSTCISLFLGFFIPLISAIEPIRFALKN